MDRCGQGRASRTASPAASRSAAPTHDGAPSSHRHTGTPKTRRSICRPIPRSCHRSSRPTAHGRRPITTSRAHSTRLDASVTSPSADSSPARSPSGIAPRMSRSASRPNRSGGDRASTTRSSSARRRPGRLAHMCARRNQFVPRAKSTSGTSSVDCAFRPSSSQCPRTRPEPSPD